MTRPTLGLTNGCCSVDRAARCASPLGVLALIGLLATGCAGSPAFSTRFPDNRSDDIEALMARLRTAPAIEPAGIAVGVSPSPTQLYAYDLRGRSVLWRHTADVSHTPMLAGPYAVTQEGQQVVGRDLKSGTPVFSMATDGMTLNGAAGSGPHAALVLSAGQGTRARARVALLRDGAVAWSHDIQGQGGVPAIAGDVVLVPWNTQFVSALDLVSGNEIARIRVRDGVVSHALVVGKQVLVGSRYGYSVLDSQLARGSLTAGRFHAAPEQELPGRPLFLRDTYEAKPVEGPESAQHRIRLEWAPNVSAQSANLQDGLLYLVFYRFVFALEEQGLGLRWVYTHDSDIVGAAAQAGGLAFADETGAYGLLSAATGTPSWSNTSGIPSAVAVMPGAGAEIAGSDSGAPDPASMRKQLLLAAQDPDARLVPVRVLAVDLLASLNAPAVTGDLVGLCDDARTSPGVRKRACEALQDRTVGGDHIVSALERHYGYLEGTTAPPVGALAKATAKRKDSRALPLLLAHLQDPSTPSEDLPDLVRAIKDLGEQAAIEPLADFLRLYHADPVDEYVVKALEETTRALSELAGPVAIDTLSAISNDPLTLRSLREQSQIALSGLEAAVEVAEKKQAKEHVAEEQVAKEQVAESTEPAVPERLTLDVATRALLPVRDELRACLESGPKPEFRARVVLVVEAGELQMVSVNPKKLEGCITPLVQAQAFPETRYGKREQITYTVRRN